MQQKAHGIRAPAKCPWPKAHRREGDKQRIHSLNRSPSACCTSGKCKGNSRHNAVKTYDALIQATARAALPVHCASVSARSTTRGFSMHIRLRKSATSVSCKRRSCTSGDCMLASSPQRRALPNRQTEILLGLIRPGSISSDGTEPTMRYLVC